MNEAPRQQSREMKAVMHELREEHGDAPDAQSATPQQEEQVSPEEFEKDSTRNEQQRGAEGR